MTTITCADCGTRVHDAAPQRKLCATCAAVRNRAQTAAACRRLREARTPHRLTEPRRLPLTRAECVDAPRPCPYVSCRHHLYLEVSCRTGAIKLNFPGVDVLDMAESCSLDVADRGRLTFLELGARLNVTREAARLIEAAALRKASAAIGDNRSDYTAAPVNVWDAIAEALS